MLKCVPGLCCKQRGPLASLGEKTKSASPAGEAGGHHASAIALRETRAQVPLRDWRPVSGWHAHYASKRTEGRLASTLSRLRAANRALELLGKQYGKDHRALHGWILPCVRKIARGLGRGVRLHLAL
jgi:hypothetical protein